MGLMTQPADGSVPERVSKRAAASLVQGVMSTRQRQTPWPTEGETIGSHRYTNVKFQPGLSLTEAPGVVVVAVLQPLTQVLFDRALRAARSHRTHPLDIAAIVLPQDAPTLPPVLIQRLASFGVVIADSKGDSPVERAEKYVDDLAAEQNSARAHLRSFVESVQQREDEAF